MSTKFAGLALAVDTPARMTIRHPISGNPLRDADGTEAWIELLSFDSAPARAHDRQVLDERMRAGPKRTTAEQIETAIVEKLAKLTRGWRLLSLDGQPIEVECTPANAAELYAQPQLAWLREQAVAFVDDVGNFRPAASTS